MPYLFLFAVEGLLCLRKIEKLIRVAQLAPLVSHLQFADNSLHFIKANFDGAREIYLLLDCYCQASGQKIN